mmetsp:Transcript_22242/g.51985  ORF Transcript_22242/g.51985 Transcript_22242/m.51985 type:complete len:295 (+) Transcript_22242:39-923(+)|eukprot:CAMPEP_0171063300 /NCGR_PEP_ID=MMETSP0766_2-20121228/5566_1 /TAXON_ID=439317 /ORGANISM="Gambierdiscus australes, Strain CAWD 149" /LENGTH=294 /DNA_ID=CAMNT_0011519179 /DNA_START=32 /DNA_END=916 /DNA_ORIENTATION=-
MAAFGCAAHYHAEEGAPGEFVEPAAVARWFEEASCVLLDVREENEINERGPIPGATRLSAGFIMFPKPELQRKLDALRELRKPIVCYTDFGVEKSRCGIVCQWLAEEQLFPVERLYRLQGGRDRWVAEGLPTCIMNDAAWKSATLAQWSPQRRLRWDVVGGAGKGGILVRQGQDVRSPAEEARLATGAVVEQLALVGERLKYRLLSGEGPAEGWVSTRLANKELCVLSAGTPPEEMTGAIVMVSGLQSEGGKLLNGQQAVVQSFDAEKQRYIIKLSSSGEEKALKLENLNVAGP